MLSISGLLVVCYLFSGLVGAEDKLIAVSVLYRHGDRTIAQTYPNDPYKNVSFWPVPYGELTNRGKAQQFALGKWLRERYNSFLSRKYLAKEFYIQSSNFDRCLMSASANLAGLFPPEDDQIWNPELAWQPIPIHTIPNVMDGLLALDKPCPEYSKLQAELYKTKQFKDRENENAELYAYLAEKTGMVYNPLNVCDLADTLFIEDLYHLTLPEWTKSVYPSKLLPLALNSFKAETHTSEMAKLRAGQFFDKVLEQFDLYLCNSSSIQKFKVFSAHDTNVFAVLNSLGIENLELVPYCGMVLFELREKDGKHYVQFLYKKNDKLEVLTIKGCTRDCDYDKFKEILSPLALNDAAWEKACGLKRS